MKVKYDWICIRLAHRGRYIKMLNNFNECINLHVYVFRSKDEAQTQCEESLNREIANKFPNITKLIEKHFIAHWMEEPHSLFLMTPFDPLTPKNSIEAKSIVNLGQQQVLSLPFNMPKI